MSRRGFTLVELVIVAVISVIVTASLATMWAHGRDDVRARNARLQWSGQAAGVMRRIAHEARESTHVRPAPDGRSLHLVGPEGEVSYALESAGRDSAPVLVRVTARDRVVLAADLAELRVTRSGPRLDVALRFGARFGAVKATATHSTSVALPLAGRAP